MNRKLLIAVALCLATSAITPAKVTSGPVDLPYMRASRLVTVDGNRFNIYCTGHGSPTVVLDSDGDDGTAGWRLVQPKIAKWTRVCSYDMAGLGFSDLPHAGLDAAFDVRALHALLDRAGEHAPFILVGYSLSGLDDRLFADRYSREVRGMILVSPNVPYQLERMRALVPVLPAFSDALAYDERCTKAAVRGTIRAGTATAGCIYMPPDPTMSDPLRKRIEAQSEHPSFWRAFTSRDQNVPRSSDEVIREQKRYGTMPLIVLTTTKDIEQLPIPHPQKTRLLAAWVRWHDEIASLSTIGSNFVVAGSSSIPIDNPGAVLSAVYEVLLQSRH